MQPPTVMGWGFFLVHPATCPLSNTSSG
jgi:hypothetical protein